MAFRLLGTKSFSEPMLTYNELDPKEQKSMKIYRNSNIFVQENAFENVVCEMAVIWPQYVK